MSPPVAAFLGWKHTNAPDAPFRRDVALRDAAFPGAGRALARSENAPGLLEVFHPRPSGGVEAGYFGSPHHPLFGCFHPAAAGRRRDTAVVLCPPFGAEELSAHRTLRRLAEQLAALGLAVLRFDPDGCGDSCGEPTTTDGAPSIVERWLASIDSAVDAVRQRSGCRDVVLVGVRLGALLAAQVASRRHDIAGWVGIAPVLSGRRFLRELQALGAMGAVQDPSIAVDGGLEAGGFALDAAGRAAVSRLDAKTLTWPVGTAARRLKMHVCDRSDLPVAESWVEALQADGHMATRMLFEGYAEMVDEPHRSVVPQALMGALSGTLDAWFPAGGNPPPLQALRFGTAVAFMAAVEERAVEVGPRRLAGVLSLPAGGGPVQRAVLMINAGAVRRVGPGRLYVTLARRWAAQGTAVLRIDLDGLGDSLRSDGPDNDAYGPHAVDDVVAASEWLIARAGVQTCQLFGLCSGAFHALHAAFRSRVDRLLLLNPLVFYRTPGTSIDEGPFSAHRWHGALEALRSAWRAGRGWRRLLSGEIPRHWAVMGAVLMPTTWVRRTFKSVESALRCGVGLSPINDLRHDLATLLARRVDIQFVFSDGEPGLSMLISSGGRAVARQLSRGEIGVHRIRNADHVFSTQAARERLTTTLDALVQA